MPADEQTALFTDLQWGFGRTRAGELQRFHVSRPEWPIHPLQSFDFEVDWGELYGKEWSIMTGQQPVAVSLVEGSEVQVSWPEAVRQVQKNLKGVQCSSV